MSWNSFLDTVVTRLATVTGINRAERSAVIDPDRMMAVPRFPTGIVTDMGGSVDPFSGEIYERQFAITIAVLVPRFMLGGEASKTLGTICEAVVEEFTHTREDSSIRLLADTDEVAEAAGQSEIYLKTMLFSADLLR